jgi:hypothetical protein
MSDFKEPNLDLDGDSETPPQKLNPESRPSEKKVCQSSYSFVENGFDIEIWLILPNAEKEISIPTEGMKIRIVIPQCIDPTDEKSCIQVKIPNSNNYWIWADENCDQWWCLANHLEGKQPLNEPAKPSPRVPGTLKIYPGKTMDSAPWIVGTVDVPEGNKRPLGPSML